MDESNTRGQEPLDSDSHTPDEPAAGNDVDLGIIVADSRARITHVNKAFSRLTGYGLREALGRKCNFLQGPGTSSEAVNSIREALDKDQSCRVGILNYRKDGVPFWNVLSIYPLYNGSGSVESYIGIQMVQPVPYVDRPTPTFPWRSSTPAKPKTLLHRKSSLASSDSDTLPTSEQDTKPHKQATTDVAYVAETKLPTERGFYRVRAYHDHTNKADITCMIRGCIEGASDVPVRVHDQCLTSEVFGSLKCDCRLQLDFAMDYIKAEDFGMVIYMPQEGRGIGLANKIKVYAMQEQGFDTVDANVVLGFDEDARSYGSIPAIISELGVKSIKLMTNNPRKVEHLTALGVPITGRISVSVGSNAHSEHYLHTKAKRMGHLL